MKLMDKVKKILFDEEEVEVPVKETTIKKEQPTNSFVDHSQIETQSPKEEDIIKEIKVPYDEDEKLDDTKKIIEPNQFNYNEIKEEPVIDSSKSRFDRLNMFKDEYLEGSNIEEKVEEIKEEKYEEKKPFKVSPAISPVFGIIDKNYEPEREVVKREVKPELPKKRTYGPVSYNEDGMIDTPKIKETSFKEDIKEISDTITEMTIDDEEEITSGIENEYIDNTNIEEAFESTSELNQINEMDKITEEEPVITVDEIKNTEDEKLDDTVETDLFNLIDSMYGTDGEES